MREIGLMLFLTLPNIVRKLPIMCCMLILFLVE